MTAPARIPSRAVVVLVGPSGCGKSTWAAERFPANAIVSSDALRAAVGAGEADMDASADAFAVLDLIVARRLARGLLTVIDTLGLHDESRLAYLDLARRHGMPAYAVGFDTPAQLCRERNRRRARRVPVKVLDGQLRAWRRVRGQLDDEGWDGVIRPQPGAAGDDVAVVAEQFVAAPEKAARQDAAPVGLRFGLQVSSFTWDGGNDALAAELAAVAAAAEDAGFESLWVMDHFVQIPQVGRKWDPMLEAYTTLGYLAAATDRARLGTLVTGITYRNVALLGKIVATLDVLSRGRAVCGIGAAWFAQEHAAYGYDFPPVRERFALLEDALELLPLMWGPGSTSFTGKVVHAADTICYPRPLQDPVPILVGGQGERRTLRLVAKHADACNLFGGPDVVAHKLGVLAGHCARAGRDAAEIEVTHLGPVLAAPDRSRLDALVEDGRPPRIGAAAYAARVNAGTVGDHVGRFRALADAGVGTAIVAMPPVPTVAAIERFAPVVAAFRA